MVLMDFKLGDIGSIFTSARESTIKGKQMNYILQHNDGSQAIIVSTGAQHGKY
jgi:orotidine-5'-phosphate decarboxylase